MSYRELTHVAPEHLRALHRATAKVVPAVESRMSDRVKADRIRDPMTLPLDGHRWLSPWRQARRSFTTEAELLGRTGVVAKTDVRNCYSRIRPAAVERALLRVGCHPAEARSISSVLREVEEACGPGLPVGPAASTVLANAVLSEADESLAAVPFLRWVDDFLIFAPDQRNASESLILLSEALAASGLELAPEKTSVGVLDLSVSNHRARLPADLRRA